VLLDRDAPLGSRLDSLTNSCRQGESRHVASRAIRDRGRPSPRRRGTLDFVVDYVAQARNWRVARVYTARPLDERPGDLVRSLAALTGTSVELQIADEADLLVASSSRSVTFALMPQLATPAALHDSVSAGHFYESALTRND